MENKIYIEGRLTKEPTAKMTKMGKPITLFSIAWNERVNTADGQAVENTDYFNVVAWGKLAEYAAALHKGEPVCVVGKIRHEKYTDKNGLERVADKITAFTIFKPLYACGFTDMPRGDFSRLGTAASEDIPF